jgi:hypothetical protein
MRNIIGNKDSELIISDGKVLNNFNILGTLTAANFPDADKSFIFEQQIPSASWTIVHNLNKFPSVVVIDSAGSIVVGEISYTSLNQIILNFSSGFSGKAYLN